MAPIAYEQIGAGLPLLCLHGGWGRGAMPFDDARRLSSRYRLIFPDRRGYGTSPPLDELAPDYHAEEARALGVFLDGLGISRPILWGHSDGAIIAALFAASAPERPRALVLEAVHFHRAKSRAFFEGFVRSPEALPESMRERLAADHGARWPEVIRMHSRAWLGFHAVGGDFYGDALGRLRCPVLVLHGEKDVHTPIAEVEEVVRRIPGAELAVIAGGAHSPHSEPAVASLCTDHVAAFLARSGC